MYKERIQQLVSILKEKKLYGYLVFSSDYHSSEYIVDYFIYIRKNWRNYK